MNRILLAAIANNIAAAIAAEAADTSASPIPRWQDADSAWRDKVLAGVDQHLTYPDVKPEAAHTDWLDKRVAEGWQFSEQRDLEKKLHPMVRPWAELPLARRVQDTVLHALVSELKDIPEVSTAPPAPPPEVTAQPAPKIMGGLVLVKYIGKRAVYRDGTYQTGLVFTQGETKAIPADKANMLLRHPDVYVRGEASDAVQVAAVEQASAEQAKALDQTKEAAFQDIEDARMQINQMADKDALITYVKVNFQQTIPKQTSLENVRAKALQFLDQFGLPS